VFELLYLFNVSIADSSNQFREWG